MAAYLKPLSLVGAASVVQMEKKPSLAVRASTVKPRQPIAAAKAKTHFLQLLDQVEQDGQPITITKRGRIVAQIVPAPLQEEVAAFDQIFGRSKGQIKILGDIVSPDWESWGPEWR